MGETRQKHSEKAQHMGLYVSIFQNAFNDVSHILSSQNAEVVELVDTQP